MYSDVIKSRLEREVVGQPHAVLSVVRGVTRIVSGLTPRERTFCAYMFMGPTGTGKTLMIQTLARILHGDDSRVIVIDSSQLEGPQPALALGAQLQPLFAGQGQPTAPAPPMMPMYGQQGQPGQPGPFGAQGRQGQQGQPGPAVATPPALGIVRIEYLERGSKEAHKALAALLETGQVVLPDGRRGSLGNCLVFVTTGLCAREILDEATRIGFTGAQDDGEDSAQDRLHKHCFEEAEKLFGGNLMSRIDRLILFHGLAEEHLESILDRRFERLSEWLLQRGRCCELLPAAREFLLDRGRRDLGRGAHDLTRDHRRFVEFPIADLLVSGRVPLGGMISVDRKPGEEHLHFKVSETRPEQAESRGAPVHEVTVR